ncbi:E4 SUMO-protein ligase PIAL2 [Linum perenne]
MAGKVAPPPPPQVPGLTVADESPLSASLVNSFRVIAVVDRLALHLQPGRETNSSEFFGLCLSLARGLDYAVANNELPSKVQDLPLLLKQVCQRKNEPLLEAAIMVLMISVKNVCRVGWFSDQETQELFSLAGQIGNSFRSSGDITDAAGGSQSVVATIFSRYYPQMKMGDILTSLEVKPGFGAYVLDFHISKKSNHSPLEKVRLFVAQTDGIDTAACIISPLQVNFLFNGRGVDKRTNIQMDTGPQLPTNVTGMLKYGTNLLQAVGTFNGNYVIIVAFMSTVPLPDSPELRDYVALDSTLSEQDFDIIEGPSRISLNCPISFSRIKIPVKGNLCKHLQCFDFGNYVEINSKRPSWRCPHCNQNVSYADICVDQNIVKVLKEVGENITHVNISADGSWKAVMDADDNEREAPVKHCQREIPDQPDYNMILDLTEGDDLMDELLSSCATEERKPSQTTFPGQTVPHLDDENPASLMGDLAHLFFSSGSAAASGFILGVQNPNAVSDPSAASTMPSPVITDAVSPSLHRNLDTSAAAHSQFDPLGNDYMSTRHVGVPASRVPTAIQALPAQASTPGHYQRSRMNISNVNSSVLSVGSNAAPPVVPTANGSSTGSYRQQFPRSHPYYPRPSSVATSMARQTLAQGMHHQVRPPVSGLSPRPSSIQTAGGPSTHRTSPMPLRMPSPAVHSSARSSSPLSRASTFQGAQASVGTFPRSEARPVASTQQAAYMSRQPTGVPVQLQSSRPPHVSNPDISKTPAVTSAADVPTDSNWRPAGRMRGSLQGKNLSELRNLLLQPSQQTSPRGVTSNSPLSEATVAPHLRGLFKE